MANLGVVLVFNELCCGVICMRHRSLTDVVICMNLWSESCST